MNAKDQKTTEQPCEDLKDIHPLNQTLSSSLILSKSPRPASVRPGRKRPVGPEGTFWCPDCGDFKPLSEFGTKGARIESYCRVHSNARRNKNRRVQAKKARIQKLSTATRKNNKMLEIDDFEIVETVVPATDDFINKTITDLVEETSWQRKRRKM